LKGSGGKGIVLIIGIARADGGAGDISPAHACPAQSRMIAKTISLFISPSFIF